MRRVAIAALCVAAVLVSACGQSPTADPAAAPGKPQAIHRAAAPGARSAGQRPVTTTAGDRHAFVRHADAICRRAHDRIGAVGRQLVELVDAVRNRQLRVPAYYRRSAALTQRSARIAAASVSALRALPRPAGDRRLARYLAASSLQAQLLQAQAGALHDRNPKRVVAINAQLARTAARARALVGGYGFRECAGGR